MPLGATTMPSGDARRMLVDPATGGTDASDWGWYDAFRGDGENMIGGIDVCDGPEVHRQFDVVNNRVLAPASGSEVHCIDPGRYRVELYNLEHNALVSSREIDYLGLSRIGLELVEVPTSAGIAPPLITFSTSTSVWVLRLLLIL